MTTTNTWMGRRCRPGVCRDGDTELDRDLQVWHELPDGAAAVCLLGGVQVRAPGRAPRHLDEALAVVGVLALRPRGTTSAQLLRAISPRQSEAAGHVLPHLLEEVRAWFGRDAAGRDRLQGAPLPGGGSVYRLVDVLVDVDLFRRLRLRGALSGPAGLPNLRAAQALLPRPGSSPSGRHARGADVAVLAACAPAAADLARHLRRPDSPSDGETDVPGSTALPRRRRQEPQGQPHDPAAGGLHESVPSAPAAASSAAGLGLPGDRCPGVFLLPQLGLLRPRRCVRHGGDLDSAGALLTLADLRRAAAQADLATQDAPLGGRTVPGGWSPPPLAEQPAPPLVRPAQPADGHQQTPEPPRAATPARSSHTLTSVSPLPTAGPARDLGQPAVPVPSGPARMTVAVVAAHGGAGASTVALAVADTAAGRGRKVHLVTAAAAGGLEGVADAELGDEPVAGWRTGRRGAFVIVHRGPTGTGGTSALVPGCCAAALVVLDLPTASAQMPRWPQCDLLVVVARASVPGLRAVEVMLDALSFAPDTPGKAGLVLVTVGPARWPDLVAASAGHGVRALRKQDRWLPVPVNRVLACTGASSRALPHTVLHPAGAVLRHLSAAGAR